MNIKLIGMEQRKSRNYYHYNIKNCIQFLMVLAFLPIFIQCSSNDQFQKVNETVHGLILDKKGSAHNLNNAYNAKLGEQERVIVGAIDSTFNKLYSRVLKENKNSLLRFDLSELYLINTYYLGQKINRTLHNYYLARSKKTGNNEFSNYFMNKYDVQNEKWFYEYFRNTTAMEACVKLLQLKIDFLIYANN